MKTKRILGQTLIVFLSLGLVSIAMAHDTWLGPDRYEVAPKTVVTLDLTSGMEFPALETGPKRERVEAAKCRLAERTFGIADISAGPKSLVFKLELVDPGVATIWVMLPPRSIELTAEQVKEYLDEIEAPADLRKQWAEMSPPRWRESYTKHPKTFIRVGDAKADRSWEKPVGMALEIVPENDPTTLRAGDELTVRVLKNGEPFPGFALNAVAGGATRGETKKSDAAGRIVFRMDKAGPWLLRGTDVRRSTRSDADWESDFATLTLAVKEK
ncbi:MAG TPA: DUF4198 domain-containing protein [Chthoniobacterales bacterium]|nr:DUF4198 domain-containing protein [Chthoniobacterales bacterium]